MKKFKPPSFINGRGPPATDSGATNEPPNKKIRCSNVLTATALSVPSDASHNNPQDKVVASPPSQRPSSTQASGEDAYYRVVWRKPTNKKHKTWDGDGVLSVQGGTCVLQDHSGKDIARGRCIAGILQTGDPVTVGGKECEVESVINKQEYLSGRKVSKDAKLAPIVHHTALKAQARAQFKNPLLQKNVMQQPASSAVPQARHDPHAHNALVLNRPNLAKHASDGPIVDVVVDPFISQFLRLHQREGVSFMYDCIMRMKSYNGAGMILADEMGLGKTLQTIALIWTLLKQHFLPGQGPLAKKALIVCPVTLTNNWKKEFRKWLGQDRIGVFVVDSRANLRDFLCGRVYQVMIIGYEKLRLLQEADELKDANFDIIICDEGHKLKSANNRAAQAIKSLKSTRRIILSGTPIQNDLGEFFVMIDFVNPGLLGTYQSFKKEFENPILKARLPDASKKDKELGMSRSAELAKLTEMFILRRTSELLSDFLPPKTEVVVFCKPTSLQVNLHHRLLEMPAVEQCLGGQNSAFQLKAILHLRKICNSPNLLSLDTKGSADDSFLKSVQGLLIGKSATRHSGKLLVLEKLLLALSKTGEKIVLVSQFTQTLHILQELLSVHSLTFCRLDGTTAAKKRSEMVEKFNRSPASSCFAFLLSAKSGGCGLNLIGASRLVLFDSDWNPSTDLQAMARIHRDGQKKPVFIYRFLTTGMIDEKIYQRQVTKQGLSDALMDAKVSGSSFSLQELRDLFRCHEDTQCLTHDMLSCPCKNDGLNQLENDDDADNDSSESDCEEGGSWIKASQVKQQPMGKPRQSNMKALRIYDHVAGEVARGNPDVLAGVIGDDILAHALNTTEAAQGMISYLFIKKHGLSSSEQTTEEDKQEEETILDLGLDLD